jgi:hypothetical protein
MRYDRSFSFESGARASPTGEKEGNIKSKVAGYSGER